MNKFLKNLFCFAFTVATFSLLTIPTALAESRQPQRYNFLDAPEEAWFFDDFNYLFQRGWINGGSSTHVYPQNSITKAELAKLLLMYDGYVPKPTGTNPWYEEYVTEASLRGIIKDTNNPNEPLTRYEVAKAIYDILDIDSIPCEIGFQSPYADIDDTMLSKLYYLDITSVIVGLNEPTFLPNSPMARYQAFTMLAEGDKNKDIFKYMLNPSMAVYSPDLYVGNDDALSVPKTYNNWMDESFKDHEIISYMALNGITSSYIYLDNTYSDNAKERLTTLLDSFLIFAGTYPEYSRMYILSGYSMDYNNSIENAHMSGNYYFKPPEAWSDTRALAERMRLFDKSHETLLSLYADGSITSDMTETERAEAIVTWVIDNNSYDYDKLDISHYGSKAFIDGKIVCDGYTSLLNTLLQMDGIEAYGCIGNFETMGHMWTIANLDGHWRMIDATFMDGSIITTTGHIEPYRHNEYFNVSPAELQEADAKVQKEVRTIDWTPLETLFPDKIEAMKSGT